MPPRKKLMIPEELTTVNRESGSESESEENSDVEEAESHEDSDSDAESEEKPTTRPYMALLQGFEDSDSPKAKRRKLDNSSKVDIPKAEISDSENQEDFEEEPNETKDLDMADEGEDVEGEVEEQPEEDSDDEEDSTNPFDTHFAHPDADVSSKRVKAAKEGEWTTKRAVVKPWRATLMSPGSDVAIDIPRPQSVSDLKLKHKLRETASRHLSDLDGTAKAFSSFLFGYQDILLCDRNVRNAHKLRQLTCLHALNHVLKTRDRVIKNNYKLAKESDNSDLDLRDQGFTRPKVLFLLPTRNSCAQIVNIIRDLYEADQQENRKRFDDSYIDKSNTFGDDKPADFTELFEGNDDDMFRLGIKFTRKTIKYFAPFYSSDILLASPLGLRMAIGSEEDKKKVDYDFLSSIELVVMDQSDALLMQNWEHVESIFESLNLQPKDAHDCDFSRVRSWYLEDWAKHFRQTVVLSAFNTPELAELFRLHCQNWAGKSRLQIEYPGVLQQLGIKAKQTFSRFQSPSVDKDPDARFKYFTSTIIPSLVKRSKDATGTIIFISSYLDFVRVRNYFANDQEVSSIPFGAISEYADVPEASRARSHFLNGRHSVLLYTERAHHFRRYQLRGVQRVIFYSLPDNPVFYNEIAGGYLAKSEADMRLEPGQGNIRVIFSKYDVMKLERIAGSKRVGKMIQERGDTFDFV
ncbi:unnamed protein product [Clonostachys chloroleuca]|uniref:U3 small nucleolar RNA-associated protein 25 n=1 Tax=Clonostachys chloroleuca TaxID=1926264 RepID=A0AA35VJN6_9HYPO|nr:unnamed protein product [Clonostachys chloroleuca]